MTAQITTIRVLRSTVKQPLVLPCPHCEIPLEVGQVYEAMRDRMHYQAFHPDDGWRIDGARRIACAKRGKTLSYTAESWENFDPQDFVLKWKWLSE